MTKPSKPRGAATVGEVQAAATHWSDAVLRCRLRGHSWEQEPNGHEFIHWRKSDYWHVKFFCEHGCHVRKWEEWDSRGMVTAKGMIYPRDKEGRPTYLLEDVGRMDAEGRGALRLESAMRAAYVRVEGGKDQDTENAPRSALTVRALGENR